MSSSVSSPPEDNRLDFDPRTSMPSAEAIKSADETFALIGTCLDILLIDFLRIPCIRPPRALNTAGWYAFWAATWYCASKSGDWTHAAIARDRERMQAASVPLRANDTRVDGALASASRAKDVPLERQREHFVAYSGLCTWPAVARLLYVYRPLFWQRSLPFKLVWGGAAA